MFVRGLEFVEQIRAMCLITFFTYLTGGATNRRSFMQLLWLLCVWVLWTARNNKQFNNT